MLTQDTSFVQSFATFFIVGYIAFCVLYGHAALRERRKSAGKLTLQLPSEAPFLAVGAKTGQIAKLGGAFALPVLLLAVTLSFTGRERAGVIEASKLFTVPARPDAAVTYLAPGDWVEKNEVVARFGSDSLQHRIAGLKSRRQELVARRDAVKASSLAPAPDVLIEIQSQEQRLSQLENKLVDLDRASFSAQQQLVSEEVSWRRSSNDLSARIPPLEQQLASELAEHKTATAALERVRHLRDGGLATISQFEKASDTETLAENRVASTRALIDSTRAAITTLDAGHQQTEALLKSQIEKLTADAATVRERMKPIALALDRLRPTLAENEQAASERRRLEVDAAEARIKELDAEMAAVVSMTQVKSPIEGRVLYRTTASSTLNGAMPLLVIAASGGFDLRIDLPRDERAALDQEMLADSKLQVVVDDGSARRLALAKVARIEDSGIDAKRFTAVLSVDLPEDMLVRMALKGTAPQAVLRWSPAMTTLITTRIAWAFGIGHEPPVRAAGVAAPNAPVKPAAAHDTSRYALRQDL